MVQTFKEYQLGNHCGHVSYEELEKACFGYIQNIAVLEKRLEIACHVKADDKVGFDFAILDKMDALERERDESRKWASAQAVFINKLEAENALLRKRLEPIEAAYNTYKEYPSSAIVKRDVYDKAINSCMVLKDDRPDLALAKAIIEQEGE